MIVVTPLANRSEAVRYMLSPKAVRERCHAIMDLAKARALDHFQLNENRWSEAVDYVAQEIRRNYPNLDIPYHSRWQHFNVGGADRLGWLKDLSPDPKERARSLIDLVIVSVLLDAGAGSQWCYKEQETAATYNRSEGLAVASFHMFRSGGFSEDPERPYRVDAKSLMEMKPRDLALGFQVSNSNPLVGLEGRVSLLNQLGHALSKRPEYFGRQSPRLGMLFDALLGEVKNKELSAVTILQTILDALGDIWPGRLTFEGINLGDAWRHPKLQGAGPAPNIVPFHKLSQWLTYSLLEPMEWYGLKVTDLNALTGLPEYRNGGLFIDLGVLSLKNPNALTETHKVEDPLVVEWRALTVALLDRLGRDVAATIGLTPEQFPLAKVLQGGSWSAGRRIAREKRGDGTPPLKIASDGTVF